MGESASCICSSDRSQEKSIDPVPGMDGVLGEHSPSGKRLPKGTTPRPTPRTPRWKETAAQKSARNNLGKVIDDGSASPRTIREALEAGRSAGLEAFELAEASEAATRASRRKQAREALAAAMAGREQEALRAALGLADEAALDHREVEDAIALIEELEGGEGATAEDTRRAKAVAVLGAALKTRGRRDLEEAIASAEAAGLGSKNQRALLAEARVTLKIVNARRLAAQERRAREHAADAAADAEGE